MDYFNQRNVRLDERETDRVSRWLPRVAISMIALGTVIALLDKVCQLTKSPARQLPDGASHEGECNGDAPRWYQIRNRRALQRYAEARWAPLSATARAAHAFCRYRGLRASSALHGAGRQEGTLRSVELN